MGDLVGIASDLGVVVKSGSWFSYAGERLGQGKERAVEFLAARPELVAAIRQQVMQALNQGAKTTGAASTEDVDDVEGGEQ